MLVIKDLYSDISDCFWLFYGSKYKSRISWMNNTQSVRIRKNELNRTIFMILDPYKRIVRYITLDYFGRIFLTYIFVDEK